MQIRSPLELQMGTVHDIVISAVLRKLAEHPPFGNYSLAVVVSAVMGQLNNGGALLGLRDGKLTAYAGWMRVKKEHAEAWLASPQEMPHTDWKNGDAVISTIIIADDPNDLLPLVRGVSTACAGLPVYRMRVFNDVRGEQKRKPIIGRHHG